MAEPSHRPWSRALSFVVGGVLLHLVASGAYVVTVARHHDVRRMDARWLMGPRPVHVMVAGDSHARFAVEGPVLGSAINVAVPGEHYGKTEYRLPWLLDRGTRSVETVALPYDAASFSSFKVEGFEPERVWGRYVDYLALGRDRDARFSYGGKWAKATLAPYVGELQTVLQFATGTKHFRDVANPTNILGLAVFEGGERVAQRHFGGADPFDPEQVRSLRRILADCRRRGIRVVLVRYPVTADYHRGAVSLGADRADRDRLLDEIGMPGVVDHLDFEDRFFDSPGLFSDGDHLNLRGKRRLSLLLGEALHEIGVLPTAPDRGRFVDPGAP